MAHPDPLLTLEHLLVVLPVPEDGGTARAALRQVAGLRARGMRVEVLADPRLGLASPGLALPVAHDPARPAAESRAAQRATLAALLARRRWDAALVHCPLPGEGIGAMEALAAAGVPTLAHHHLVRRDWAALAGAPAVGWSAVSAAAARRLEGLAGLPTGSVAVLGNPLPAWAPLPRAPESPPLVVQLGRLDGRKGAGFAPDVARAIAPARLVLAGDGPMRGALHPAEEAGAVADVPALLARAHALLLPAEHEGAPLAVLEAVRAGCPVVATAEALEAWPGAESWAWIIPREAAAIAATLRAVLAAPAEAARRAALARAALAADTEAALLDRLEALLLAGMARAAPSLAAPQPWAAPAGPVLRADTLGETAAPWRGPVPPAWFLAVHAAGPGRVVVRCADGTRHDVPGGTGWRWVALPAPAVAVNAWAPLTRARGRAEPALRCWAGPVAQGTAPPGARLIGLPPRLLLHGAPPATPAGRVVTLRDGPEWEGVLAPG